MVKVTALGHLVRQARVSGTCLQHVHDLATDPVGKLCAILRSFRMLSA